MGYCGHGCTRMGSPAESPGMMGAPHVWIDADGCPVKNETYRVAGRYGLNVTLVADSWLRVPEHERIRLQLVERGSDAADDYIVEHCSAGDVIIAADIPLAARCIEKGAVVVTPRGRRLDADSIGEAVAVRDLGDSMRSGGEMTGGPPPFGKKNRSLFLQRLDATIQRLQRQQRRSGT